MTENGRAEVVPDLLRERAQGTPRSAAVRAGDTAELTYGEWEERSSAAGQALVDRGVRPGDRVGLVFANDRWVDYAVCYLGVQMAGAAAVPLGTRFAGPELEAVLAHAGVAGVVVAGADVPVPPGAWMATPGELERGAPAAPGRPVPVGPDDLAEIVYTSGTTGRPKGVACTHRSLLAHDVPPDAAAARGPTAPVSFLHAFPIGTHAGQEALRVPLRIAGRVCIAMPTFEPEQLGALVERHRVVRLQLVPAMARLLVGSGVHRRHDLSSVRRVILSSAPAAPALFARLAEVFPGATLWNAYALTEAGPARTLMQWDPARPTAVGQPVGETEVRVVDAAGRPLASGETGDVWLRRRGTPNRSYYRDPEATAAVFVDGWVRTGDVGHLDRDGYLHLTDRQKDVIISGGLNVSSVEVEHALCEHPAVVEAAVFGVAHPVLGEDVGAAVVVRAPTSRRELQDVVRARLAEHKVPHRMVIVDQLPHNASGKVVKRELRERFGASGGPEPVGARDATEALVASVWEAVLGVPVGVEDDFFALGGQSLAAAQIVARLRDASGVELPVAAVFEAPTVAELAARVSDARTAPAAT